MAGGGMQIDEKQKIKLLKNEFSSEIPLNSDNKSHLRQASNASMLLANVTFRWLQMTRVGHCGQVHVTKTTRGVDTLS